MIKYKHLNRMCQWRDEGLYLRHMPQFDGWWVSWGLGSYLTLRKY